MSSLQSQGNKLFTFIENFPPLQIDPSADWTFIQQNSFSKSTLWLCYAKQRDYLSVPKTHIVLRFDVEDDKNIDLQLFNREDYFSELADNNEQALLAAESECGFYQYAEQNLFLLVDQKQVFEMTVDDYQICQTLYHQADSKAALIAFLS